MTCRECIDFLLAYFDGELSEEERAQFELHLQKCPPCVHYLRSYEVTMRACRGCFDDADDPMPEELVKAILAARRSGAG